jgi:hypothetical protein
MQNKPTLTTSISIIIGTLLVTSPLFAFDTNLDSKISSGKKLTFVENGGTDTTAFQPGTVTASTTYTLPPADGVNGNALTTDGAGTLSWANATIPDDSISNSKLKDNSVTTDKIQDGEVKTADIKDNTITASDIAEDAIGASELASNSVASSNIIEDTIIADDIAANAIENSELANNSVASANIIDNTISAADINVSGNGTNGQLLVSDGDGSMSWSAAVTDTKNTINNTLTSDSTTESLSAKQGKVLKTAVDLNTAKTTNATHTGDVTGSTALTIGASKVKSSMILDNTITASDIAADTIDGTELKDTITLDSALVFKAGNANAKLSIQTTDREDTDATLLNHIYGVDASGDTVWFVGDAGSSRALWLGARGAANDIPIHLFAGNDERLTVLPSGNVGIGDESPDAKLDVAGSFRLDGTFADKDGNVGSSGQILSSTATGTDWVAKPTSNATHTGDVTGSTALTIGASKVKSSMILDNTITASDIAADAVAASELANNSVASANIIDNTVTGTDIAADTIDGTELKDTITLDSALVFKAGNANAKLSIQTTDREDTDATLLNQIYGVDASGDTVWFVGDVGSSRALWLGARGAANDIPIHLFAGNDERLTVLPSGNVGIGTTSPAAALEILGADSRQALIDVSVANLVKIGSNLSSAASLSLESAGGLEIVLDNNNNNSDKVFSVLKDGSLGTGTELFKVQEDGNVFVGNGTLSSEFSITGLIPTGTDKELFTIYAKGGGASHGSSMQYKNDGAGYYGAIAVLDDGGRDGRMEFRVSNDNIVTNSPLTSSSTVMTINQSGNLGIGRGPVTNKIEVEGSASKSIAGDWLANSDKRLKKDIVYLNSQDMLDKVLKMKGVSYTWNDDKTGSKRPEGIQHGFIAQDLKNVWPQNVKKDNLGYYQTPYGTYDHMYVEAIKALNKKIEKQDEIIKKLMKKLDMK